MKVQNKLIRHKSFLSRQTLMMFVYLYLCSTVGG